MRIGIMCHSSIGGSVRIATELSSELARRGHRVHLFTRTTPFCGWEHNNGVVVHRNLLDSDNDLHPAILYANWPAEELQIFLSNVLTVIAQEGLDLLHFHYAIPFAFVAEEVKLMSGLRAPLMVGTLHGTDVSVYGRDPIKSPILAQTLRKLDGLTTVSSSHSSLAVEALQLRSPPEVIPNFVNLSKFRPHDNVQQDDHENRGIKEGRNGGKRKARIIHISNFRPIKDTLSMANIFIGIRQKMNVELWLVGDGPEMGKVKTIFKQEGIEEDVFFWGLRRDVAAILNQTDLLLITSRSESFCLSALEAMACGIPVLATNVGGIPEVVVHKKTGILFQVGDHSSAVNFAVTLLSDPVRHKTMGKAAAEHARRFGCRQIVSAYEGFYQRLLYSLLR
jgi:N-acetyl-alpha-D-glucosaminyl L-malate synthase BshA